MKGKKIDSFFLSEFITECTSLGISSSEEIVAHAQSSIEDIDVLLKKINKLKIKRSKLLDVIEVFSKPSKHIKPEEVEILSFFKIQHPQICKFICDFIKSKVTTIDMLNTNEHDMSDILFCIKQLIEHKVIYKSGNFLLRGESFNKYLKSVFQETV